MLAAPFLPALLLHVALGAARRLVVGAYTVAAIASAGSALFRDPFADPDCWRNCADNVFLAHGDRGLATAFDTLGAAATLITGALALAVAAGRLAQRTPRGARRLWPLLVPVALAGAAEAAYGAALLFVPPESPDRAGFTALFVARATCLLGVGAGIAWIALRARRTRAVVARIGVRSVSLREALARALGDPGLEVAYPRPGSGAWVDAGGAPVTLDDGRAVTRIERGGEPVAIVAHDPTLLDGAALAREIGAAARLSVDNERLQAAVLAQLADLRASRAEIVETGDAARRRLERDLHDGAQQRLLALSYELRLAGAGAGPGVAPLLADAEQEARTALEDLRELAHGIYPAILAEAGLRDALDSAAETASLPVELGEIEPARLPAPVETAAYLVAVAGIDAAARAGASHAVVSARRDDGEFVVTVDDDGGGERPAPQPVADRVGALGGRLSAGPGRLQAVIPCA